NQPWPSSTDRRLAAVSAFGFGGTNAHLILEEAPESTCATRERSPYLLVFSAKTEPALRNLVARYKVFLRKDPAPRLADVCFTANTRRSHFVYRVAVVTETVE